MILRRFYKEKEAKLNPHNNIKPISNFPSVGITCFSKVLIDRVVELFNCKQIAELSSANGKIPVYELNYKKSKFALYMSNVGASHCVINFEEMIAMGLNKLIMFGTCGVLDKRIKDLAIIIPNKAIRDEGTSFHYMKPSKEIVVNEKYKEEFISILNRNECSHFEGKVWTTDAPYRETESKIKHMKKRGAIAVDMECSAMASASQFRNKDLFQFFYAADNLDSNTWDKRSLSNTARLEDKEMIIYLVLELALKINY